MRADIADTLRSLAQEHFEGRSSLEHYRRLRAELLDGLLALDARPPCDLTQPREPAGSEVMTQPRAAMPLESASRPSLAMKPRSAAGARRLMARGSGGKLAALTALAVLLALGVVLLVRQQRSRAVAPHPVAAAVTVVANSAASADPFHTLLLPLLNDDDWSDSSVLALNDALRKLPPARIAADRNTDWFNSVVEIVRFRWKQQEALANAPLTPATSPIAALAQTLGIDLPSSEPPAGGAQR